VQELEFLFLLPGPILHLLCLPSAKHNLLSKQRKVRLVRGQGQHDEVRVESVEAVPSVGVVVRLGFGVTEVVHDLVLALPRSLGPGDNDLDALPKGILLDLFANKKSEMLRELGHELGSRSDAIAVERLLRQLLSHLQSQLQSLSSIIGCPKAARALLVHLGSWCTTIYGHVDEPAGLDDVKKTSDVLECLHKHIVLVRHCQAACVVVGAIVNDAIHVQIQIVELWNLLDGNGLVDVGEAL
jgi:hypothetical protein